jgi:hypothetical protein
MNKTNWHTAEDDPVELPKPRPPIKKNKGIQ